MGARHGAQLPRRTYGYLIGEVIRRVTGLTAGTYVRQEVCEPLGVDAWIGVPPSSTPDGPVPRITPGLRFARGFMRSSEMSWMGPNPGAFSSAGSGGSIAVADPESRLGFGYAQNAHLGPLAGIDSRPGRLLQAVHAAP